MRQPGDTIRGPERAYRIEACVGRGGFGTTYRASCDDRTVALKELRIEHLQTWKSFELFQREIAVLRRIRHPRVPAYVDSFGFDASGATLVSATQALSDDNPPLAVFLVQEWVEGRPLAEVVATRGRLPLPAVRVLLSDLLDVLAHLHAIEPPVVHRDVTPRNILLDASMRPYLVDFGAVQDRIRRDASVVSTSVGTFGYAPLEQFIGNARPATDLYALAMCILYALTRKEPNALPVDDRTGKVKVREALPDAPRNLARALDAMLEPAVGRRPASAAEVRRILDRRDVTRTPAFGIALLLALGGVVGTFFTALYVGQTTSGTSWPTDAEPEHELFQGTPLEDAGKPPLKEAAAFEQLPIRPPEGYRFRDAGLAIKCAYSLGVGRDAGPYGLQAVFCNDGETRIRGPFVFDYDLEAVDGGTITFPGNSYYPFSLPPSPACFQEGNLAWQPGTDTSHPTVRYEPGAKVRIHAERVHGCSLHDTDAHECTLKARETPGNPDYGTGCEPKTTELFVLAPGEVTLSAVPCRP